MGTYDEELRRVYNLDNTAKTTPSSTCIHGAVMGTYCEACTRISQFRGLLAHPQLVELVNAGILTDVAWGQINSSSIDLTLGKTILVEQYNPEAQITISLRDRKPLSMKEVDCSAGYTLAPGEFVLASSVQKFNLPLWLSAEYKLKSSMARIGLEHLNAGWCDAGWNNSVLTLELKNMTRYHGIEIKAGDHIGQIVFFGHELVNEKDSYATRGRYNGDQKVSAIKP